MLNVHGDGAYVLGYRANSRVANAHAAGHGAE